MREEDKTAIEQIARIRAKNNIPWMKILTIALEHAPKETRAVMREVGDGDSAISFWWKEIANAPD